MTAAEVSTITLKEIVTHDFHAAAVFEKYSLDFCCRGGKTIDEACRDKGIGAESVVRELMQITTADRTTGNRVTEWDPAFLIDFVVNTHHAYVAKMIPVLSIHTRKLASDRQLVAVNPKGSDSGSMCSSARSWWSSWVRWRDNG